MNDGMERVLGLLQFAEDVSKGVESTPLSPEDNCHRFGLQDFEPLPIGPNGIETIVSQIPPLSWNCTSEFADLSTAFYGAGFSSANSLVFTPSLRDHNFQRSHTTAAVPTTATSSKLLLPESHTATNTTQDESRYAPSITEGASIVSTNSSLQDVLGTDIDDSRYRNYQTGQWNERFEELMAFRASHGHLFVPHTYPPNQKLAQWVKRQRYQYKLKQEGKHSTLSDEREERLSQVGFIWGSHAACWQEHFQSLESFVMAHGHCCVPTDYKPDSSLAVWCKHQRRQFKRFQQGQTSTMTEERYKCLQSIGFEWNPRSSSSRAKKVID